jgi:hypothetical protein
MHLAWWAEPGEMYLSTGICAARLNVQSGFSCWLQSIPSVYLGVAG